jgi:hypothetical protein
MILEMPSYIAPALPGEPLDFKWGRAEEDEMLLDQPRLMHRLNAISYRGVLSFSVGVIEWIVWRLSQHFPNDSPLQTTQAAWAGTIDWRYLKSLDVPEWEEEWETRVGGPLAFAFQRLTDIFIEARRVRPVSQHAAPLSEVPIKLLTQPEPYKEWRRFAIQRLTEVYPMKDNDRLGPPVPREALDPSVGYRPEMAQEFLALFLSKCDPAANPFLASPEEMIRNGFEGVPYSL